MHLQGKVAIVTGSSRGIGKAIALALAREGAHIIVAARTEKKSRLIAGTLYETAEAIEDGSYFRGLPRDVGTAMISDATVMSKPVSRS